MTEIFTTVAIR